MKKQPHFSSDSSRKQKPEMSILSILGLSLFLGLIAGAGVDKSHILPIAIVSAVILFANRKKISIEETATPSDEGSQQGFNTTKDYYAWPELGQFDLAITGESYQDAIKQLIQENAINCHEDLDPKAHVLKAHLIPDNDNPYDSSAVRVDINYRTVGYINREEARNFRRRLNEKKLSDQITTCNAIITGGSEVDGKTFNYGVKLDIESLSQF